MSALRRAVIVTLVVNLIANLVALARRRLLAYEIAERSMVPALDPGDWVLGLRRPREVRVGHVVVFDHPHRPGFELVKRIRAVAGDEAPDGSPISPGTVWVTGDAPESGSVDSATFGPIEVSAITARLLARYHPRPGLVSAQPDSARR